MISPPAARRDQQENRDEAGDNGQAKDAYNAQHPGARPAARQEVPPGADIDGDDRTDRDEETDTITCQEGPQGPSGEVAFLLAAIDAAQSTHSDPGGPRVRLHRALVASRGAAPSISVHICAIMSCVSGTDVLW